MRSDNIDDRGYSGIFAQMAGCSNGKCRQIVAVSGETSLVLLVDIDGPDDVADEWVSRYHPKCMYPAPPIIRIPAATPPEVRDQLKLAFQFYWSDVSACAAKVRASVECLLDAQGISRTTATGGHVDLNQRINQFTHATVEQDLLHALRWVGNVGTHGTATHAAVFDALTVYEMVLETLYDVNPAPVIRALAAHIIANKGKY
jgi:hypothetical protein